MSKKLKKYKVVYRAKTGSRVFRTCRRVERAASKSGAVISVVNNTSAYKIVSVERIKE
tara:strand:+ start:10419 stop:10592 length:174 start_codon:yes stop_codon:yes gene_type:complete